MTYNVFGAGTLNFTQKPFVGLNPNRPTEGAHSAPKLPSWILGGTSG